MHRRIRGILFIIIGLILVITGISFYTVYDRKDQIAGQNAEFLLTEFLTYQGNTTELRSETLYTENSWYQIETEADSTENNESTSNDMPVIQYAGYDILGVIWIPDVDIELPILDSQEDQHLQVAPCRYSGSIASEDLIIMGHNYKSHFTPLHRLQSGALVQIEDIHGTTYQYEVAEITSLHKYEGDKLASEYPLTLFTCTKGGQNRLVIRCIAK